MDAAEAQALYAQAKSLHAAGRHTDAIALLDALDAVRPNSKNILLAKAECLFALGDRAGAARLCHDVLAQQDDRRARRILAACVQREPPAAADPLHAPALVRDSMLSPPPLPAKRRAWPWRLLITLPVLALIGSAAIAVAKDYVWKLDNPGEIVPAFTASEITRTSEARRADRAAQAQRVAEDAEAVAEVARRQPGYVVPEAEWNLDPVTGAPAWQPGAYHQLPCPGTWSEQAQGPRTLDIYLPMAYGSRPDENFPVLVITMPMLNPGFRGYETWAERRGVILIVINSSCNDCGVQNNRDAQLAAYNFLIGSGLRAHPQLNFATGVSGGAQMGWLAAGNSPNMFAGVLMVAHGGLREVPLAPHIRVGYVNGQEDWNADYIDEMIARLRANGNEVRHDVIPGGHIEGPVAVRTRMLDWLLDAALRDLAAAGVPADQSKY